MISFICLSSCQNAPKAVWTDIAQLPERGCFSAFFLGSTRFSTVATTNVMMMLFCAKIMFTPFWQLREHLRDIANAYAQAKGERDDQTGALVHLLPRQCLDAADDDHREHDDGSAAQHRLRHDGEQHADLRTETAQQQEDDAGQDDEAIDDAAHDDQADILREGSDGKHAEKRSKQAADTIRHDTAALLIRRRLSIERTVGDAADVADGLHGRGHEQDAHGNDGLQIKFRHDRKETWDGKPVRVRQRAEIDHAPDRWRAHSRPRCRSGWKRPRPSP